MVQLHAAAHRGRKVDRGGRLPLEAQGARVEDHPQDLEDVLGEVLRREGGSAADRVHDALLLRPKLDLTALGPRDCLADLGDRVDADLRKAAPVGKRPRCLPVQFSKKVNISEKRSVSHAWLKTHV